MTLALLELSPRTAAHLVAALNLHREWARRQHIPTPTELDAIRDALVRVATSGQERPSLVDIDPSAHPPAVAPLLLTYPEAASVLGLSERQVRRLVADGRVPSVRHGRSVRIHRDDLEAYAQSLRSGAAAVPAPSGPDRRGVARFKSGAA